MSQPFGLSARGGLYTSLNQLEMLAQPGVASKLTNFEVDTDGGYRRINGFSLFGGGSSARPNGDNKVLGIFVYADGVIVCSGTGIFLVRLVLHGSLLQSKASVAQEIIIVPLQAVQT